MFLFVEDITEMAVVASLEAILTDLLVPNNEIITKVLGNKAR